MNKSTCITECDTLGHSDHLSYGLINIKCTVQGN